MGNKERLPDRSQRQLITGERARRNETTSTFRIPPAHQLLELRASKSCIFRYHTEQPVRWVSSPLRSPSAPSAPSRYTPPKNASPAARNGTNSASNAVCATRCWTRPTPTSTITSYSAACATPANSAPRATDLAVAPALSPWTRALIWETPIPSQTSPSTLFMAVGNELPTLVKKTLKSDHLSSTPPFYFLLIPSPLPNRNHCF